MAAHKSRTAAEQEEKDPSLPFPIFRISTKIEQYLLYDINTITWLRRTHNILGVLIGTLPQFPQQNVFLGLPLELQPEEVRLLVEKGIAYVVSDLEWHERGARLVTAKQRREFLEGLREEGREAARVSELRKEVSREKTMKRLQAKKRGASSAVAVVGGGCEGGEGGGRGGSVADDEKSPETNNEEDQQHQQQQDEEESEFLFESSPLPSSSTPNLPSSSSSPSTQQPPTTTTTTNSAQSAFPWTITPTTSYPPLPLPSPDPAIPLPSIRPSSYALFKHLHSKSYFLSPGLRFGCQFLVYPGDPLRFHSHFLAVGMDWDEEFDLLDLVGGGRLGTGVKKGWLVGGVEVEVEEGREGGREGNDDDDSGQGRMRGKEGSSEMEKEQGNRFEGDDGLSSSSSSPSSSPFDAGQGSESTKDAMKMKQNQAIKEPQFRTFCLEWGGM